MQLLPDMDVGWHCISTDPYAVVDPYIVDQVALTAPAAMPFPYWQSEVQCRQEARPLCFQRQA